MRLTCVALLVCGASAYVPTLTPPRRLLAPRPLAARFASPIVAAAPGSSANGRTGGKTRRPQRENPASRALLQKLDALRSTRTIPVDATALASLVRPVAEGLRGNLLLEVLTGLRKRGKWEIAIALAQLLEASAPPPPPPPVRRKPRPPAPVRRASPSAAPSDGDSAAVAAALPVPGDVAVEEQGGLISADDSSALLARARAAAFGSKEGEEDDGEDPFDYSALNEDDEDEDWANDRGRMLPVETVHYNILISSLSPARRWREALELLARMRERGVPRDTVTYNALISVMKNAGRWKLALKLLRKMRNEKVAPNTITFSAAVAACARAGEWRTALRLLGLMRQAGVAPNTITFSAAISACEKGGEWARALKLLRTMQEEGVAPDLIIFNAAIGACARGGQADRALSLLDEAMPAAGIAPDVVSCNAAITAHANAEPPLPDAAMALLHGMETARGVCPDRISYNAAISALGRAGQWENAIALLRTMIDGDAQHGADPPLRPNGVSYTAAISACAEAGEAGAALDLLDDLRISGLPLETIPFSKAIAACTKAAEWEKVNPVIKKYFTCRLSQAPKKEGPDNKETVMKHAKYSIRGHPAFMPLAPRLRSGRR